MRLLNGKKGLRSQFAKELKSAMQWKNLVYRQVLNGKVLSFGCT